MRGKLNLLLILMLVLTAETVKAQDETLLVETNLVTVNVSINDKKGNFVAGLDKENFEIFDDETKQKIEHFSAGDAPVSYGIVYDMHPTTEERKKAVLESLRQFTKELNDPDDFFLLTFNMRGSLFLNFIPSIDQLEKHLLESREPNALYDAIYTAGEKLRTSRNLKRTLLIISDSADHQSSHNFGEITRQLKSFDVQVFAVVFDENSKFSYGEIKRNGEKEPDFVFKDASSLDRAALLELTLKNGGTAHFPTFSNSFYLYTIFRQIADEIRKQYTIGFYPKTADGIWHNLRVNLRGVKGSKKFSLTYRLGYQSPKKD